MEWRLSDRSMVASRILLRPWFCWSWSRCWRAPWSLEVGGRGHGYKTAGVLLKALVNDRYDTSIHPSIHTYIHASMHTYIHTYIHSAGAMDEILQQVALYSPEQIAAALAAVRADDAPAAPETKCEWCGRTFERPSGLPTHQKTCEKKPDGWEEPKPLRQRKRHCPKQKQPLELEVASMDRIR